MKLKPPPPALFCWLSGMLFGTGVFWLTQGDNFGLINLLNSVLFIAIYRQNRKSP